MSTVLQSYQWLVTEAMWKPIPKAIAAGTVSGVIHVARRHERLRDAFVTFSVGSTSGTVQLEVLTPGQNAGDGVDQLTTPLLLSGTADTPTEGVLISTITELKPGDMLGIVIAGTMTNLVNGSLTAYLEQLQKL